MSPCHGEVCYWADAQGRYSFAEAANRLVGPLCAIAGSGGAVVPGGQACVGEGGFAVAPGATLVLDIALALIPATPPPLPGGPPGPARGWIFGAVYLAGTGTLATGGYQLPGIGTTDGAQGGPTYTVAVTPPPGYVVVGPASAAVTVAAGQGAEANFFVRPAFAPFWVESFVPGATEWSGPDAMATAFGTRPQWGRFLVAAPQAGARLFVLDPLTRDYA